MLCTRMKQFREYNGIDIENLAEFLGISPERYKDFEAGKEVPTIEIIEKLLTCYKITMNEFYGCNPKLSIYDENTLPDLDDVDSFTLKMADLSWDETQLILHYRNMEDLEKKEELINTIINN